MQIDPGSQLVFPEYVFIKGFYFEELKSQTWYLLLNQLSLKCPTWKPYVTHEWTGAITEIQPIYSL